ncbi:MAG: ComF family protein [Patescibacteria group bacterium]
MNFILDTLFPKFCLGCQKEGTFLCEDCKATLEVSEYDYCLCSKHPLLIPPGQALRRTQGKCNKCSSKRLSGLYFALPYKEKSLTRKLIYQFKYKPYTKNLAKTLASLIIEHLIITQKNTDEIWNNAVLIPVPLFSKKLKERGYNQSEELAKELSKILRVPVISDSLKKIKQTESQIKLSKEEREKNLRGAFKVIAMSDIAILSGKKVFLVDDVYTTGSTMEECARVLRNAGAKSVWGICLAREG